MKHTKQNLWNQGVLLISAFAMLATAAVAWFINSQTADFQTMSFAAQNAGGATLYKTLEVGGVTDRVATDTDGVLSITNTAHWKDVPETPDRSDITAENLLPGQCEYFFILANGDTDVKITNLTITRGDGTRPDLADCLGLYLIPVTGITSAPPATSTPTVTLTRQTVIPEGETLAPLTAAYFLGTPATTPIQLPTTGKSNAYILALVCDPLYSQDGIHNSLAGKVKFSLQFDAATGE